MHQDVALHFASSFPSLPVFTRDPARVGAFTQLDVGGQCYLVVRANEQKARLSSREQQAVDFVSAGRTQKEAAFEMGIAASTLRVLLHRAMKKLAGSPSASATLHTSGPSEPLAQSAATR